VRSISVVDIGMNALIAARYDLVVLASGYEKRCVHAPTVLENVKRDNVLVLGFEKHQEDPQRQENDAYFERVWTDDPLVFSSDDEGPLYEKLNELFADRRDLLRIAVDYSSMSRLWYAGILNWARHASHVGRLEIDFGYSMGTYSGIPDSIVIKDIEAVPGCEGGASRFQESVVVLGLGFYGMMAQCVLEHLEPDSVFPFIALPGTRPDIVDLVMERNEALLSRIGRRPLNIPLTSIETASRYLAELVMPFRRDCEVALIPMGPKPHVLASIILSMRFPEIVCLRVSHDRTGDEQVTATGDLVVTRVVLSG